MSKKYYASMDSKGYIKDGKTLLDELFAAWLVTRRSHSDVFVFLVPNADETMMLHKNDPDECAKRVKEDLTTIYSAHFDEVIVNTSTTALDPNTYRLNISLQATLNEVIYDLSEVVDYREGTVVKIMDEVQ